MRLLVCCALAAGCGVPVADHPSTAAGDDVPYGLLDATPATTTTLPELASASATIWLVADDGVVPVNREVTAPLTIVRAFEALADAATDGEARLGLRSAIPDEAIGDVSISSTLATVDLEDVFLRAAPREQLLALAQMVYTATEIDDVAVVQFTLDDQRIGVPRGDGSISERPVSRLDYGDLVG